MLSFLFFISVSAFFFFFSFFLFYFTGVISILNFCNVFFVEFQRAVAWDMLRIYSNFVDDQERRRYMLSNLEKKLMFCLFIIFLALDMRFTL